MFKIHYLFFVIIYILCASVQSNAQYYGKKKKPIVLSGGLYSSHFLSDLGGKNGDGTYDYKDLNLSRTRFGVSAGVSIFMAKQLSVSLSSSYIMLSASDKETNSSRTIRNLSVRTNMIETLFQGVYWVPKTNLVFRNFYFTTGLGLTYFQPKAKYNDNWYNLRTLGTEGQLVNSELKQYPPVTFVVPFGFGRKFVLKNKNYISIDFSFRKSFTDYLDDAGGKYGDANLIATKSGPAAAYFSNPSEPGASIGTPGSLRASDIKNDNYFLVGIRYEMFTGNIKRPKARKKRKPL